MNISLISEEGYAGTMENKVLPFLQARKVSGYFERNPGEPIYYENYDADSPKGVVVLVHGFSSFLPKFYEITWYFLQAGYHVRMLQQRGHGLSYRGVPAPGGVKEAIQKGLLDPEIIQIRDYRDLVYDLHYYVKHVVVPSNPKRLPLYLFAHSMGGGVSACYLGHYPGVFKKAVLSSPMLGMNTGGTPLAAAYALSQVMITAGRGSRPIPGSAPFSETPDFEGSCSTSRQRYEWGFAFQKAHPEFRTCISSFDTALQLLRITQAALRPASLARIKADVLLLQAEDDTYVTPEPQEKFIAAIPHGKLVRIPGSKHEIYRSGNDVLQGYLDIIMEFLN